MLRGIPNIISPELLKILHEMGHGDEICLGDCNFPACSCAEAGNGKLARYDSIRMPQLLDAILSVFPLDYFVDKSVTLMAVEPGDDAKTPIWDEYKAIIAKYDSRGTDTIEYVSRLDYYDRAKKCFAVVATGESAAYGNIILKKGPLFE